MPHGLIERLQACRDVTAVMDCALEDGLRLSGARLGNVQLMNRRSVMLVDDVEHDARYSAESRRVVRAAGVRAVQSTPLISSGGACVGMLSTHFPSAHRLTALDLEMLQSLAQRAAQDILSMSRQLLSRLDEPPAE